MNTEKQGVMSKTWFCVLMLLVFFPLGLYCMWRYGKFNKTARIIITVVIALVALSALLGEDTSTPTESQETTQEVKQPEKVYPGFVTDDFDKSIYDLVEQSGGEVTSITKNGNERNDTLLTIAYANDEEEVNALVERIKPILAENRTNVILSFVDKNDDDQLILVEIRVNIKGNTKVMSQSEEYMTAYKKWVRTYVSANHHYEFETMVKENINDPDSFEHHNTVCIPMINKKMLEEKNQVLKDYGYDAQLEMYDLLIICEYRGSNAFGGIVKNTALGIHRYSNNTMIIVDNLSGWSE